MLLTSCAAPGPPGVVRGLEQHAPQQTAAAVPRVKLVLLGDSVSIDGATLSFAPPPLWTRAIYCYDMP